MKKYISLTELSKAAEWEHDNEVWEISPEEMDKLFEEDEGLTVYFITVFEYVKKDDRGWPDFGASRTWGFYADRDTAIRALHENWTDMREGCYNYAVVEGYDEGIAHYHGPSTSQWFQWNSLYEGYREIDTPDVVVGFGSWAFG